MRDAVGYGIDFGTTNSLIAVAGQDGVEVLSIDGGSGGTSACLPSIVYFDHDSYRFAGTEAISQYEAMAGHTVTCGTCGGAHSCTIAMADASRPRRRGDAGPPVRKCPHARLAYGLKHWLADSSFERTESWGHAYTLDLMISWVLRALADTGSITGRSSEQPVVVGLPVRFRKGGDGEAARELAMRRLREASKHAGLGDVEFLDEPKAALLSEKYDFSPDHTGVAVAVDFGGGTFDVAVSAGGSSPWLPTAVGGVPIGGEQFDGYLFRRHLAPKIGLTGAKPDLMSRLSTLRSMAMNAGRGELLGRLRDETRRAGQNRAPILAIIEGGFIYDLWYSIQQAKIELSSSEAAHIDFHKSGIDLRVPVSRASFEELIRDDLDTIRDVILDTVRGAGVQPADVGIVLRTGGSSSIPLFVDMLHEVFPQADVTARPALTTVAAGLAHRAREIAGCADLRPAPSKMHEPEAPTTVMQPHSSVKTPDGSAPPMPRVDAPPQLPQEAASAPAREATEPSRTGLLRRLLRRL